MSTYYTVRLRRFKSDVGLGGGDLNTLAQKTTENLPVELREKVLNETGSNNSLRIFQEEVIFDVSPTISESRSADYSDRGLPGPSGIVVFRVLGNRRYSVSARLVSRNWTEANKNFLNVSRLKSWMIPESSDKKGTFARPPILRLNGYRSQFSNIPVVLTNLTINYPEDVDYLEGEFAMVPIIQTIDFELLESHKINLIRLSSSEVSEDDGESEDGEFDLDLFKQGILPAY